MQIPKNIFLDRDGTIIEDKHYLSNPNDIVLLPEVAIALSTFMNNSCSLFLVSNQSGIGRGMFTEDDVISCNKRIIELLAQYRIVFKDILWCPHLPEDVCNCRKPNIGMWEVLSKKYSLLASESIMIGDKKSDITFGIRSQFSTSFLVKTGKGEQEACNSGYVFPNDGKLVNEIRYDNISTKVITTQNLKNVALWLFPS